MALASQPPAKYNPRPFYFEIFEETHPFYTCGDKVRGVLRVDPTLRPKNVSISFKGISFLYDTNAQEAAPVFFNHKKDLFQSSGAHENFDILQRGTASDGKVVLPFEFTFPHTCELPPPADRNWRYSKDSIDHPRFQHSPGFVIPPSCTGLVPTKAPNAPKITYGLEACLDSVNTENPRIVVRHELKFLPPAPEYDLSLLQPDHHLGTSLPKHLCRYKFIRTRRLLPGYEESSKLGKVKDMLVEKELFFGLHSYGEVPFARFNLFTTSARILVIGSPVPLTLTLQHLDRSSSLPTPPDVLMRRIRVQLLPVYSIFVPRPGHGNSFRKEIVDIARDTWTLFDRKFDEGNGQLLHDGLKLSDLGDARLAHDRLLPSFTSYGLTLEYELQVEIWGECAKHEFSGLASKTQVQIVTGWNMAHPQGNADLDMGSMAELDSRPEYHEIDPMSPRYDLDPAALHELETDTGPRPFNIAALSPPPLVPDQRPLPPPYMG
ncbi:hypothetical protein HBI56_176050 [Parastagonospora nodorum]|uniref:Arrestin-like N-terminal domain-containing protein n=1 Tax=Phaeosphaeria nodorum (strain SN15 / ATCC MYA-4574 / FGSC 10173) TaxID=321614 RepID=A0A7U2FEN3_PHANO|nr:hypothetical protein HBH56_237190 [Parastagonospora nodorum]QRD03885.1 hypothetical protein JI435_137460 [Parastagonospora nodorum SN15]KAH3924320.1 hypothetical protein HBH54_197410 [Parastagonospora nodorum]KAH3942534.1 hypothetical protein HBH53_186060 [Parastagonospora nodorum]KAH4101063.1 hypothetical protein HBH46_142530 [Parastagonospora nodorum]